MRMLFVFTTTMTTTTIDIHGICCFTLLACFFFVVVQLVFASVVLFQWRDRLLCSVPQTVPSTHDDDSDPKQTDWPNSQRAERQAVDTALEQRHQYTHVHFVYSATKWKSNMKMIVLQNSKIYLNLELGFSLGKFLIIP